MIVAIAKAVEDGTPVRFVHVGGASREENIELPGAALRDPAAGPRMCRCGPRGKNALAMLVRRKGETLAQLLTRLDLAIARAQTDDVFTDELNSPPNSKHP